MMDDIVRCLRFARSLVVLTGAGVSAESGIPTFRDALTGLWARYNPEQLATPGAFARDPALVARWYDERRARCAACAPNPGHFALAQLEQRVLEAGGEFVLLTQNVDRLHQRAGSKRVCELHGTLWAWRCTQCGAEREEWQVPFAEHPPRCDCGGLRRPGVVWFGETLPVAVLAQAQRALAQCDVFVSLGTSAAVEPAASLVYRAKDNGARTIEINLQPTPISGAMDYSLYGKTGELLPPIVARLS